MQGTKQWGVILILLAGAATAPLQAQEDQPLGGGDGLVETGDTAPLTITGFGVGNYSYNAKTDDNTFAASKVAVGLFREISDHAYVYGQLTTLLEEDEATGEPVTETEIDNLLFTVTPSLGSGLSFTLGKADAPIGFERDDEVLNFLPTTSFNFELARPAKLVGAFGRWSASPHLEVLGLVANGWDSEIDSNHGKTGGARIGLYPSEGTQLGLSALYGSEGEVDATNNRYLLSFDYSYQPSARWVIGGEANYAGDRKVLPGGGDATWSGATLIIFHHHSRHIGLAARAEVFDDPDGMRTGQPQTLSSFSFSPMYLFGVGRSGIFANVEHTTFRIPQFQIRGEVRVDHSSEPFFDTKTGMSEWGVTGTLQLVATF